MLAESLYSGRGLSKDLTLALEYAQKASLQPYNRVAQNKITLVKQIIEERANEANEREKKDRDHISKITAEHKRFEEEARKASETHLERKERTRSATKPAFTAKASTSRGS